MLIRKEGNEGLVWNKKNHRVYKVDEEAYQILHDLDVGVRVEDVAKRHNITVRKIMNLVKIIKKECK
jgi:Mor family transcriptional regulator